MRRLLQVVACSAFLSLFGVDHPASAQQNGNGSGYNWSGFYGGGNLGGAFGGSDFLSSMGRGVPFFEGEIYPGFPNPATPGIIAAYRSNEGDFRSFTGGLQAGYNFWAGGLLLGVEADINFMNAKMVEDDECNWFRTDPTFGAATYTFRSEIDANYIASLRPRIGIPVGGMLLYATGGVAVTTLNYEHNFKGSGGIHGGPTGFRCLSTKSPQFQRTHLPLKRRWVGPGRRHRVAAGQTSPCDGVYSSLQFGNISIKREQDFSLGL